MIYITMCTVTYIPHSDGSFTLTQNRDESTRRPIASPPVRRKINGIDHVFPVDPQGMGTWIGASAEGKAVSILNGGKKRHQHQPPYKHSRGLLILEYFKYENLEEFKGNYSFQGLEPFTMLVFENQKIYKLIFQENELTLNSIDPSKPFIYSSSTLYSNQRMIDKKINFLEWYFYNKSIDLDNILEFHNKLAFENESDKSAVPEGHILRTVSITSIHMSPYKTRMDYFDRVNDIHLWNSLKILSNSDRSLPF